MLHFSAQVQFRNGTKWASKNQASLDCHKNSRQSNIPGAFMKNEHQRPKAEVSILLFSDVVVFRYFWGGGANPFLNKRDGCSICSYKHKLFTEAMRMSFNNSFYEITYKKRLFVQKTPHQTQFFHKGPPHALWGYSQFKLFFSVWKSFTCDNRIGLRPRNTCSQICWSRAGYICLHVIQSTS